MNAELLVEVVVSLALGALGMWLAIRRKLQSADEEAQGQRQACRQLEAEVHQRHLEAASERNRLELEHQERAKAVRERALEEGRQLGLAESRREHVIDLTARQADFAQRLATQREDVARETRERARAEFEMQAKLFDVTVRPYLNIDKIKGLIRDEELIEAGYQYQLWSTASLRSNLLSSSRKRAAVPR